MLDEAQNVGSGLGLVAEMAARLRAHNRWMVSGTPLSTGGLADIQARFTGTACVGRRPSGSGGLMLLSAYSCSHEREQHRSSSLVHFMSSDVLRCSPGLMIPRASASSNWRVDVGGL